VSSTDPVLVTGATGFVASRLVELLLARGYRVRGTVRSVSSPVVDTLRQLPGAADRLEVAEADLLRPGSFDVPAAGCGAVMHTASPYVLDVKDPQRDLVDPAVEGTRAVLTACVRAGTVARVVLTSSMAAITDEPPNDRVLTEADWNERSSLERNPYYYSKTMAEKAAWSFMEQAPGFDLVAINPFMVVGPSLAPALNTSNRVFVAIANGEFPAIVDMHWGFTDVRDVAEAHVRAMETPAAHGRYICAGEVVSMRTVVELLAKTDYSRRYRLPTRSLDSSVGTWLARLSTYARPKGTGTYLRTHLGRVPRYDTTKIRSELGMSFRPAAETILETMADLERWGHLRQRQ
jgi:dihydroflavonol-4-reductase